MRTAGRKQKGERHGSFMLRASVMLAAIVFGVTANTMVDRGLGSVVEVRPTATILLTNVPACASCFR